MPYYTGKYASITIDGVYYPLDKWTLNAKSDATESTSFKSRGFREFVYGLASGDITASGFVQGISIFAQPAVFRLAMTIGGDYFKANAVITGISYDVDIKGPTRINITATITGRVELNT